MAIASFNVIFTESNVILPVNLLVTSPKSGPLAPELTEKEVGFVLPVID